MTILALLAAGVVLFVGFLIFEFIFRVWFSGDSYSKGEYNEEVEDMLDELMHQEHDTEE